MTSKAACILCFQPEFICHGHLVFSLFIIAEHILNSATKDCPAYNVLRDGECEACDSNEYSVILLGDDQVCKACGRCYNQAQCEDRLGRCPPHGFQNPRFCQTGYLPRYCFGKCLKGTYGVACKSRCGPCKDNQCHHVTGECQSCQAGYRGSHCRTKCVSYVYGENCAERCGSCYRGFPCDTVTGHCDRCKAGFSMPLCKARCPGGRYGQECGSTCGKCKEQRACDSETGHCQICQPGFQMPFCVQECDDGFYGINCAQACGACAEKAACDEVTGYCPGDCASPDKVAPLCKTKRACQDQFYGPDCAQRCGQCKYPPCDEKSGNCTCPPDLLYSYNTTRCQLCRPEYTPPDCHEVTQQVKAPRTSLLVLGLGLSAAFTFLVLAVTVALWVTRRHRKKKAAARPGVMLRLQIPDAVPTVDPPRRGSLRSLQWPRLSMEDTATTSASTSARHSGEGASDYYSDTASVTSQSAPAVS